MQRIKLFLKKTLPKSLINARHYIYEWLAAKEHGFPSNELYVIGVTGTSGKSSVVYMLRHVLETAGYKVGSLSTIDFYIAGKDQLNDQKMTMLGRGQTQSYLRKMVDAGCDIAIVETTSEGRLQHRHRFVNYDMMLLTNLYPEHLEAHGGFEKYKQAKRDIFAHAMRQKQKPHSHKHLPFDETIALVNGNSEHAHEFLCYPFTRRAVFGRADHEHVLLGDHVHAYYAHDILQAAGGLRFTLLERQFSPALYGEYQAVNLSAVIAVARELSIPWEVITRAVDTVPPIPGRVEFIKDAEKKGITAIVDYAFEPVAIAALYSVVKLLYPKRIIHVTGSTGGGRDVANRFAKGKLIGAESDIMIVTNEDPYDDDPMEIINHVADAAVEVGKQDDVDLFRILNRQQAINKAVALAEPGDIVLVTGKGSEQRMCVAGGEMIPWDDRDAVRAAIHD